MLQCGADVHATDDALGRTALHYACERACSECVDALLAVGADLQAQDLAGATAMSLAWDVSQGKKDSAASAVVQMQQLARTLNTGPSSPSPAQQQHTPPPFGGDAPPPPNAKPDDLRRKATLHVRDSASDWSPLRAPSGLSPSMSGVTSTSGASLNEMVTPSGGKEPELSSDAKQRRCVRRDKWPIYSTPPQG